MSKSIRKFFETFPLSTSQAVASVGWFILFTGILGLFLAAAIHNGGAARMAVSARALDERAGIKFPVGVSEAVVLGRFQAMNMAPVQDGGLALQWHLMSWPNPWFERFPLTIDQNLASGKSNPSDESSYWMAKQRGNLLGGHSSQSCPQANPHTPSSFRIWDSAMSSPGNHLGELILSDSLVDSSHTDLSGTVTLAGYDFNETISPDAHGTHVAGVLGALRNGEGIVGVIPGLQTRLFPLAVRNTRNGPRVDGDKILRNLDAIISDLVARSSANDRVPRVVLLSWAFFESDGLNQEFIDKLSDRIRILLDYDLALVVPAGNLEGGRVGSTGKVYPAAWAGQFRDLRGSLLPVSASDVCSRPAWFSNLAANDLGTVLTAPGERIYSTLPGNDYGFMTGTSASAAQVAAVLAMTSAQFPDVEMKTQVHTLLRTSFPLSNLQEERIVSFDAPALMQGLMAEFGWIARY